MNRTTRESEYTRYFPILLSGKSRKEMAEELNIGERTLYNKFEDPEFMEEFINFCRKTREMCVIEIAEAQLKAVRKLKQMMDADSESVQLRASLAVIKLEIPIFELEVDNRIRKMKSRLDRLEEM